LEEEVDGSIKVMESFARFLVKEARRNKNRFGKAELNYIRRFNRYKVIKKHEKLKNFDEVYVFKKKLTIE